MSALPVPGVTAPFVFSAYGTPRPQPRPRKLKGRFVSTADPKAKLWRAGVERAIREAVAARGDATPLFVGAVRVRMVFTFQPPASAPERIGTPHTHKPDVDNLAKAIADVMEACGVFKNDSQISAAPPEKWWGARAGVNVLVESMGGERRVEPLLHSRDAPDWLKG
jgi:Holliday junction resolvase RusA-like endonuclease